MARVPAKSFEDLVVWQKSHALVLRVYRETSGFPRQEVYGLTAQMRRAAVSVPANIAESFEEARPEKARYHEHRAGIPRRAPLLLHPGCAICRICRPSVSGGDVEEVARMLGAYAEALLTPASSLSVRVYQSCS